MLMNVIETELPGVVILEPRVFKDDRGYFLETWSRQRYIDVGIKEEFVQDNISFSTRGTLRGLHYQSPNSQGKLVQVLSGEVLDVAVDIRKGSPTFGKSVAFLLSEENHRQLYVSPGFAHGFCVTSETAVFSYKCTDYYDQSAEGGIRYDDPALAIKWPGLDIQLSPKDEKHTVLSEIDPDKLPVYEG
jgi:dTDP-4-dehydrorhamnose 3,5-epimerase